jgi:hypothetical protein
MGSIREFNKVQSPPEVFGRLSNNYTDKQKQDLFEIWKAYNELITKCSKREAIKYLYGEDLTYFTLVGLDLFNKEYLGAIKNVD